MNEIEIVKAKQVNNPLEDLVKIKYFALYRYGSRVFGTSHDKSDWDFVAVYADASVSNEHKNKNVDISVYSKAMFQRKINKYDDKILTCLFMPKEHIIIQPNEDWDFELDKQKLWESFSKRSKCLWSRSQRLFNIDSMKPQNFYVAKKEIVHSLRTLDFGIQIAKLGYIENIQVKVAEYHNIMNNTKISWEDYEKEWEPVYKEHLAQLYKATHSP